jgi:ABC-type antimicrobial peptide transport system permease subunit
LAVIQGFTDEHQINRDIEYRVGSDYKLTTSTATNITSILNEIEGIQNIQALPTISGRILSSDISIVGIDPQKEIAALNNQKPILNWHSDTFLSENNQMQNAESALEVLSNSENGIFLSNDLFSVLSKNVGDVVNIAIRLDNPTINSSEIIFQDVEILGIINHMPGGLSGYSLTSQNLLYDFINGSINADDYRKNLISNNEIFASQYQIDMINDNPTVNQILDQKEEFLNITGVTTVSSLNEELNVVQEDGFGFGVTGLLTLAASVSLVATFVSSFAFSSIIMERRKKEFAVLRAIGARKSQIYKMALAENFLMMLIGVIWGTFIGVAVAVIFNGFFSFVTAGILNQLTVDRLIIFPWQDLIIFGTITIVGMMTATVLSIRNSVNADLTVATKDD